MKKIISRKVKDNSNSINTTRNWIILRRFERSRNRDYFDDDTFKILYRSNPRTSNLYFLPKIHKKDNPGRPIINSVGSLTEISPSR